MKVLYILFSVFISLQINCSAQFKNWSLRDIDSINVEVLISDKDGLPNIDLEKIKVGVELRLRQNGITVLDENFKAHLLININAIYHSDDPNMVATYIELIVREPVFYFWRELEVAHFAITFFRGNFMIGNRDVYLDGVIENAIDMTDIFLNQYYKDNPK